MIRLVFVCLITGAIAKPHSALLNKQELHATPVAKPVEKLVETPQPAIETAKVETKAITPTPIAAERPPEPKQVKVAYPVGCEAYRPLVAKYAWNVDVAMNVMRVESGCNPNAANWTDNHGVCRGSFGLFQISCHSGQVYDPASNIAIAWAKYQARGWQPWSFTTCKKIACY